MKTSSSSHQIAILGATGSIGSSTLQVIEMHPHRYQVFALAAHTNVAKMTELCLKYQPTYAVMVDDGAAQQLAQHLTACSTKVLSGTQALCEIAAHPEVDLLVAAIVGIAGLDSTFAAAKAGKTILLANKESLVMAGNLLLDTVQQSQATLLPLDSEHNALFQCMPKDTQGNVTQTGVCRLILTASGGPFREHSLKQMAQVTVADAVAHPRWSMGQKISVDSATLANKGLELMEAYWLFGLPATQLDVLVHPQSIIHSLVEYEDGSQLAQLSCPDMRTPIAHALAYPERIDAGVQRLNLAEIGSLSFEAPDESRFPCLRLAREALLMGGILPAVFNSANEAAVAQFLAEKIPFLQIAEKIECAMQHFAGQSLVLTELAQVFALDQEVRRFCQ